MQTILLDTVITQIIKDGYHKPASPLFAFYNDGDVNVSINNFRLRPGESFGVEADSIVAASLGSNIDVANVTQYFIQFAAATQYQRVSMQLIQTYIRKN